jgi:hypothetical protein
MILRSFPRLFQEALEKPRMLIKVPKAGGLSTPIYINITNRNVIT